MRIAFAALAVAALLAPSVTSRSVSAEMAPTASQPSVQVLSEEEFGRYLAALDSLLEIRAKAATALREDPAMGTNPAAQASWLDRSRSAMESHGFTAEAFEAVHWNVMQAFAQVEIQAHADEVRKSLRAQREELARTQAEMSADARQALQTRIDNTEALLEGRGGVPEPNVVLVRARLDELKATFNRGMSGAQAGYQAGTQTP